MDPLKRRPATRTRTPQSDLLPGRPWPMGASWDGNGVNFAVFSSAAQRIELCLFDTRGEHETRRIDLPARTNDVWVGRKSLVVKHGHDDSYFVQVANRSWTFVIPAALMPSGRGSLQLERVLRVVDENRSEPGR